MLVREHIERSEDERLASYAIRSFLSRGRRFKEDEHPFRTAFQRDRDRIVHSKAFRRLEYKTQVFVNHEGDYYRTRLTHTLEVAQISRTIARALRLNEDLAEAIALAHDLGHTPFGHSGERVLNELMKDHGGFEHNRQSLRVVDLLENRYPNFRGLNLTWEVREGIFSRLCAMDEGVDAGLLRDGQPSLEAQITDLGDEIAYNAHDIDDGLTSGMLDYRSLESLALWTENYEMTKSLYPGASQKMLRHQTIRGIINAQVTDLLEETVKRIEELKVADLDDVRRCGRRIVGFSKEMGVKNEQLKAFLLANLYRHFRVVRMGEKARRIIEELFNTYIKKPEQMPPHIFKKMEADHPYTVVCDYIAGMTDRFAMQEHRKLFDPHERV